MAVPLDKFAKQLEDSGILAGDTIKDFIPPNVTKDATAIARFEREVTAAAKLRHPNSVAADDADCANGVQFLVMEMVEGSAPSALVKRNGPFYVEEAVNYVLQASKGLEFAHKKGVVHRDIKPANLLLDTEGTVDYMAPEQALNTKTMTEVIAELERCTAGPTTAMSFQQSATTASNERTLVFPTQSLEVPTIPVDPGKHRLKVEKEGFTIFGQEFEMRSGDKTPIKAKLVPLEEKPAMVETRPAPVVDGVIEPRTGWQGWPTDAPPPAIAPFDAAQAKKHQEAWARHLGVPVEYTNSIGMKFMLISTGEFTMGSTSAEIEAALVVTAGDEYWNERIRSAAPQHKLILSQPIYFGVHEVTQRDYEAMMGKNPSHFAPMGTGYRMPTEAEWEYACRAGTTTKYWLGDKDDQLITVYWSALNSGGRTHAVGALKENPFGLFDIHGNVWEWVQDWWEPNSYTRFQGKPALAEILPPLTPENPLATPHSPPLAIEKRQHSFS